ncbi:MAG: YgjV family protein [Ruminococcus sp.]|nr:YgjV family protein [Candidatus Copronaster equi]
MQFVSSNIFIIAQIFGFAAMLTAFITYQLNRHKSIMFVLILVASLWCCHFLCLKEYTAVAMNFINVIRCFVYSKRDKKWADKKFIPYLFVLLSGILTIITWKNLYSLLPFFGSVFAIFANWQTNPKTLKLLTIPVNICWFTYNLTCSSWAGMINEAITFLSIVISFIRYRIQDKKQKQDRK